MKFNINAGAISANERQNTPSKKACNQKIQNVLFRPIQHSAQLSYTIRNSRSQTNVTQRNCFSKAPRLQTERLGQEVRSGFGSPIATLFE